MFLECTIYKININHGGSYIDSLKWIKSGKVTINPKNNDDICFWYAIKFVLNYEQIK